MEKPVGIRHGRATVYRHMQRICRESDLQKTMDSTGTRNPQGDETMATTAATYPDRFGADVAIPVGDILPWAVFGSIIAVMLLYFVSTEQGATAVFSGSYVHEFVHDGRHLLGFPCH